MIHEFPTNPNTKPQRSLQINSRQGIKTERSLREQIPFPSDASIIPNNKKLLPSLLKLSSSNTILTVVDDDDDDDDEEEEEEGKEEEEEEDEDSLDRSLKKLPRVSSAASRLPSTFLSIVSCFVMRTPVHNITRNSTSSAMLISATTVEARFEIRDMSATPLPARHI
ncbi:hypothetical protein K0M31_007233 [Melipona bicolor]|uniref:Uncharacterized protein n=1 Tax=Melipona bicolor TaxID=60889 RepID=A0AA40KVL5_9HYME|nr:hypothetical protein K0M31_007233 [Melipona bicolor]